MLSHTHMNFDVFGSSLSVWSRFVSLSMLSCQEAIGNIWPIGSLLLVAHSQNVAKFMSHISNLGKHASSMFQQHVPPVPTAF
jgi:hypothetical protein